MCQTDKKGQAVYSLWWPSLKKHLQSERELIGRKSGLPGFNYSQLKKFETELHYNEFSTIASHCAMI